MTYARRPSLLEAGEPLLLCRSTISTAVRFSAFSKETGLGPEAILSSTLCAMPLPIYSDFGVDTQGQPRKRWAGTKAEVMWHPLMWLPPRLAGRYTLSDPDTGETELEDDDTWAIRVAFEMTASGLYDPDTGTWIDILATVGINIDDELDLARVQDWLDGYPDEVLDDIDLTDYLDVTPSSWALDAALAMRDDLEAASWALIADDLLGMADETLNPENRLAHRDTLMALRSLAGLGEALLTHVPPYTEDDVSTGAEHEPHAGFFSRISDTVDLDAMSPEQFVATDYLSQVRARLHQVREAFWPYLEALDEESPDSEASVYA